MDKETRKRLKNEGKAEVERRSQELRKQLRESNPVGIGNPQWAGNYKEVTLKERIYKKNRTEIYPASDVGVEFLLQSVELDWSRGYLPIPGYYLQCKSCGDLVPMDPEIDLSCRCKSVIIEPSKKNVLFDTDMVQVTKLMGKASQGQARSKKWWKFWE
ncbi:MAG: hypothetical protein HN350_00305 [Phycisphaerales bacterium]|jgi:hypothetical protein|nr:hypothetical protein [Phycisphaerales bacterium]